MTLSDSDARDADLVAGVLAGDQAAFAAMYDRYADRLYDFAQSMLRERQDAADAVADTFITAAEKLSQLREPDLLRPWLYSVTRRECLKRLNQRKRVAFDGEDRMVVMPDEGLTPEQHAEADAMRRLVWDAAAGMNEKDRAVLDLHLRQGLDGAELAAALDVKPAHAYVLLSRMREQMERSIGALAVARGGRDDCEALAEVLKDWDGRYSPIVRKRVARHIDSCDVCGRRRAIAANPFAAAFAAVPMMAAPAELRERVLSNVELVAHQVQPAWRRHLAAVVAAVVVLGALVGGVAWWTSNDEPDSTPTPGTTAPTPTATAPTSPPPSTTPSPKADPPKLAVDRTQLDLSRANSGTVVLTNTGGEPLTFTASVAADWLTASTKAGEIRPGESTSIVVTRTNATEGQRTGQLSITSNGGDKTVSVTASRFSAPQVSGLRLAESGTCNVGRVTARVTDESGIRSVRVAWSGPTSGSKSMSRTGGSTWATSIGPFGVGGTFTVRMTATDTHGRSTTSSTSATINPCPG